MMTPCMVICGMILATELHNDKEELCGSYCLFVALNSLDARIPDFESLEKTLGPPPRGGHSLAELAEAAERHGFKTLGVHTSLENLSRRPGRFACIAHLKQGHFAIIAKVEDTSVHIIDPPSAKIVADNVWNSVWDGDCLLVSAEPLISEAEVELRSQQVRLAFAFPKSPGSWWRWGVFGLFAVGLAWFLRRQYRG